MSEYIRKMIDKVNNFNRFINENIGSDIKLDIDFVYNQYPELADIGTQEQYSQYLKTIFPNTKTKGVFYHASPNKFTTFNKPSSGLSHIWFSGEPITGGQYGSNIYTVLLNIQNPLSEYESNYSDEIRKFENPTNPNWVNNYPNELPQFKYDGTIRSSRIGGGGSKSITVRNPEQIHILGSEKDVEEFKKFVKK